MYRRTFIGLVLISWPLLARAQSAQPRIGFLGTGSAATSAIFVDALREGLRENGLVERRDYVFEFGWADGDYGRFPSLASQMAQNGARIILATTISAVKAAQQTTKTIPIVMTSINDPVGAGLVDSLARPGGNTTGLASLAEDVSTKLIQLLREAFPNASSIAVAFNPANPSNPAILDRIKVSIETGPVRVATVPLKARSDFEGAFEMLQGNRPDALLILPDFMLIDARETISGLALRYRLPLITNVPEYTDAGALISYGAPRKANYRRSAYYVRRILDGARPAELPIEQPTTIELSVNLTTAKKLGLTIPERLLLQSDRIVE